MLGVTLEQLRQRRVQLHDSEVEIEAWPQPHDVCRVLELSGGPTPLLQGGDAAAKEICAYSAYSEPSKPEAKDAGDGNLQPIIFRGHVTPIAAACYWGLAPGGKRLRVLLDNPASVGSPFIPLAAELSLQISFLLASSRDPGDSAG